MYSSIAKNGHQVGSIATQQGATGWWSYAEKARSFFGWVMCEKNKSHLNFQKNMLLKELFKWLLDLFADESDTYMM